MIFKKNCPICKKEFNTKSVRRKYCSDNCSYEAKQTCDKISRSWSDKRRVKQTEILNEQEMIRMEREKRTEGWDQIWGNYKSRRTKKELALVLEIAKG